MNFEKDFDSIKDSKEYKKFLEKIKIIEEREKTLVKREYLIFEPSNRLTLHHNYTNLPTYIVLNKDEQ